MSKGIFKQKRYDANVMNPWAGTAAEKYTGELDPYLAEISNLRYSPTATKALGFAPEEDYLNQVKSFVESGQGPNSALWNLTAQRYVNALTPRLSGAGVLTSGPGIDIMQRGVEDLATTFSLAERERQATELGMVGEATAQQRKAYQDALQGLTVLESLPIELRRQLIETLFKGQMPIPFNLGQSTVQQIGGGGGMGSLFSMFGGGASSGGGG